MQSCFLKKEALTNPNEDSLKSFLFQGGQSQSVNTETLLTHHLPCTHTHLTRLCMDLNKALNTSLLWVWYECLWAKPWLPSPSSVLFQTGQLHREAGTEGFLMCCREANTSVQWWISFCYPITLFGIILFISPPAILLFYNANLSNSF